VVTIVTDSTCLLASLLLCWKQCVRVITVCKLIDTFGEGQTLKTLNIEPLEEVRLIWTLLLKWALTSNVLFPEENALK
jgi:hypothetical protein